MGPDAGIGGVAEIVGRLLKALGRVDRGSSLRRTLRQDMGRPDPAPRSTSARAMTASRSSTGPSYADEGRLWFHQLADGAVGEGFAGRGRTRTVHLAQIKH